MLSWLLLFLGGIFEIGFVISLKLSNGFKNLGYSILTLLAASASFYLLALALVEIPIGVGYAVWAGIGAVGSVMLGVYMFGESRSKRKIFLIFMIIIGIVGLKLSTN